MVKEKVVYTYNELLLSLKKERNVAIRTTWMNPEDIMLSVISQSQKDKYILHDSACMRDLK